MQRWTSLQSVLETVVRRLTSTLLALPHNGGAHGAPAKERRGAKGSPQVTELGCGAEPHVSEDL